MFQVAVLRLPSIVTLNRFLRNSNNFVFVYPELRPLRSRFRFYMRPFLEINGIYNSAMPEKMNTLIKK